MEYFFYSFPGLSIIFVMMLEYWIGVLVGSNNSFKENQRYQVTFPYWAMLIGKIPNSTLVRHRASKELYMCTPHRTNEFCKNELDQILILN